jgi:hypothetical protein
LIITSKNPQFQIASFSSSACVCVSAPFGLGLSVGSPEIIEELDAQLPWSRSPYAYRIGSAARGSGNQIPLPPPPPLHLHPHPHPHQNQHTLIEAWRLRSAAHAAHTLDSRALERQVLCLCRLCAWFIVAF